MDKVKAREVSSVAARVTLELDFVQETVDLVANRDSLNPFLNAVAEVFRRRRSSGRYATGNHNIKLDSLMYADTSFAKDFD